MNRILVFAILSICLVTTSCKQKGTCVNKEEELTKVENVLEKYVMANENQDFSLIEQIWAPDDDIVLIGTDSDEKLIGWNQINKAIKHQFAEFEDTYISVIDQNISMNETANTAWFSEVLNYNFIYHGKAQSFEGIRFTGVLEKRKENWKLVQCHISIPVPQGTETKE